MITCKDCGNLIDRKAARENDGSCSGCAELREAKRKISNDLLTSFGGRGKRGFVQWLKKGKFLQGIEDDADIHRYNDRLDVIDAMIGGKFDRLLEELVGSILAIAKEETEANE